MLAGSDGPAAEAIRGGDDALAHVGIAGAMPRPADDDELASGPMLTELPGRDQRRAEIQPAMNQDPWNAGETLRAAQQGAVVEPGIVAPIMRDQPRKPQPEGGSLVAGMWLVGRMQRDEGDLPIAPVPRRLLMDRGIGVHQKPVIGIDEAAGPIRFGNAVAKTRPGLGEVDADAAGYPIDL